jgi:hypothetical protein
VTTKLTLMPKNHPDEDTFESYAFDRLSDGETEKFEEHLLICEKCQGTLAQAGDYIRIMKAATAAYVSEKEGSSFPRARAKGRGLRWNATAAAALLLTCLTALLSWRTPLMEPKTILLDAYRGSTAPEVPSTQSLDLEIDLTGVRPAAGYRVESVDAAGRRVWFGGTPALLPKGLQPGVYWVRLSTNTGEALREYGLTAVKAK